MDITGKIIWAGQRRSGVSGRSGQPWASQDFVIESVSSGPYGTITTNVVFTVFGEDKLNQWNPQVGDQVAVGYGISAHEYQGKWFNEVRAYKYDRAVAAPQQQAYGTFAGQQVPYQQPNVQYQQQPQQGYQQPAYGTQAPY